MCVQRDALIHIKHYLNDNYKCCTLSLVIINISVTFTHKYELCDSVVPLESSVKHFKTSYS
jgi:hypothetical protein